MYALIEEGIMTKEESRVLSQETLAKRLSRFALRKTQRDHNRHWARFIWVRTKLKLQIMEVAAWTEIPKSTLGDWEAGVRTDNWEEVFVLADFYNQRWQERYSKHGFPLYDGLEVREITFLFLLLGINTSIEGIKEWLRVARKRRGEMEKQIAAEKAARELAEKAQMNLFELEDEN